MQSEHLLKRARLAELIAIQAGQIINRYYRSSSFSIETKDDGSPVTEADRHAEQFLRAQISHEFPDDSILGEEYGVHSGTSEFTWVLDPIDGTKSFIARVPLFTTLIAVLENDAPATGVIHNPATHETVSATIERGCTFNGIPTSMRSCEQLSDALVLTTDPSELARRHPAFTQTLTRSASEMRTWADGYGYLMLATGRADLMVDPVMNRWDVAPLLPVVTEAGGVFSDFSGSSDGLGTSAVAAGRQIHAETMRILS